MVVPDRVSGCARSPGQGWANPVQTSLPLRVDYRGSDGHFPFRAGIPWVPESRTEQVKRTGSWGPADQENEAGVSVRSVRV